MSTYLLRPQFKFSNLQQITISISFHENMARKELAFFRSTEINVRIAIEDITFFFTGWEKPCAHYNEVNTIGSILLSLKRTESGS